MSQFTDALGWQVANEGNYSSVDFAGFPDGTHITLQYEEDGLTFSGVNVVLASALFVNDGWGLFGPMGVRVEFDTPQNSIAVDYSGAVQIQLLRDGAIVHTSTFFQPGGFGNFAGLVSDESFDEAYLFRPAPFTNQVFIDDLHWGSSVPAPGALAFLSLTGIWKPRRRR